MANLQDVAMKVLSDPDFAQKLVNEPEATLRAEGIEPTPEMLDALKGVDVSSVQGLAKDFQDGKAAH
jgi:hypothetical protein